MKLLTSMTHITHAHKTLTLLITCMFYIKVFLPSRSRVRTEREERKIEGDLRKSQRACEQLDSQKVGGTMSVPYPYQGKIKYLTSFENSLFISKGMLCINLCLNCLFRVSLSLGRTGTGRKQGLMMRKMNY